MSPWNFDVWQSSFKHFHSSWCIYLYLSPGYVSDFIVVHAVVETASASVETRCILSRAKIYPSFFRNQGHVKYKVQFVALHLYLLLWYLYNYCYFLITEDDKWIRDKLEKKRPFSVTVASIYSALFSFMTATVFVVCCCCFLRVAVVVLSTKLKTNDDLMWPAARFYQ